MSRQSAGSTSIVRLLVIAGSCLGALVAYSQGQDGGPSGGHPGARVDSFIPGGPIEKPVEERMGFRPAPKARTPAKTEPAPEQPPVSPRPAPKKERPPQIERSPEALRELKLGAEAYKRADYEDAASRFRAAAKAQPTDPLPHFALGQALIATGRDEYAARAIRKAVRLGPFILTLPHSVERAHRDFAEFDRVMKALEVRAAAVPSNADSKFVLAVQRFLTGDPRCRETFDWLSQSVPGDEVVAGFVKEANLRFGPRRLTKAPAPDEEEDR